MNETRQELIKQEKKLRLIVIINLFIIAPLGLANFAKNEFVNQFYAMIVGLWMMYVSYVAWNKFPVSAKNKISPDDYEKAKNQWGK